MDAVFSCFIYKIMAAWPILGLLMNNKSSELRRDKVRKRTDRRGTRQMLIKVGTKYIFQCFCYAEDESGKHEKDPASMRLFPPRRGWSRCWFCSELLIIVHDEKLQPEPAEGLSPPRSWSTLRVSATKRFHLETWYFLLCRCHKGLQMSLLTDHQRQTRCYEWVQWF